MFVICCGLGIEVFASLGIIAGRADRACAFVLAAYCVATAVLFKQFWKPGDFWADPNGTGRGLFWDFLKNLSLAAGFLVLVVGADGSQLSVFLAHPLASSLYYASPTGKP